MLDDDGQPVILAFNYQRNLVKSIESLIGLCRGLLADGVLSQEEITYLHTWLNENTEVTSAWPGDVIANRVREIMTDGVITLEEAKDLRDTLTQIIGGAVQEHGAVSGMATRLPIDPVDTVEIPGRSFCFTGKFIYGSRSRCEQAVECLGADVRSRVTLDLDYLVIGALASRDWAFTSHGRKIEAAVANKAKGSPVLIIAEEQWSRFVRVV